MHDNDPDFPIPFTQLPKRGYPGSRATYYREMAEGRLITTEIKVRGKTRRFVLKKHADIWYNSLPKRSSGPVGETLILQVAEQNIAQLGAAVAAGHLDRNVVVQRLAAIAEKSGLLSAAA